MAKDPKSAKRRGKRAEQTELLLKAQAQVPSKVQLKKAVQIKEKAMALAAAAVLTLPLVVAPPPAAAQTAPTSPVAPLPPKETTKAAGREEFLLIRMERTFTVLGVGDGHTIFRDAEGSTFYLDPATGDKQFVSANYFLTLDDTTGRRSAGRIKFRNVMIVAILGTDVHGNTVMRDARNETFTLDPKSGDKILTKWSK